MGKRKEMEEKGGQKDVVQRVNSADQDVRLSEVVFVGVFKQEDLTSAPEAQIGLRCIKDKREPDDFDLLGFHGVNGYIGLLGELCEKLVSAGYENQTVCGYRFHLEEEFVKNYTKTK